MSISNSSPFFLPNNKKLCTHGASALSAPTIPFPKRRRRQPWRRPSFAQAASRAAHALHGAGFQYCRRCSPHPHPVHDPIHGDVSSPPRTSPWSLYRIIVISSSLMGPPACPCTCSDPPRCPPSLPARHRRLRINT